MPSFQQKVTVRPKAIVTYVQTGERHLVETRTRLPDWSWHDFFVEENFTHLPDFLAHERLRPGARHSDEAFVAAG